MKLTILNATGKFDGLKACLEQSFAKTASQLDAWFDHASLDVTISAFADGEAPEWGIGGFALNPYRLEIQLEAERADIRTVIETELPGVLAHEMHHVMRLKSKVGAQTLAENLIFEGLACHFERQFNGGVTPSLFKDIQAHDWRRLYQKMQPDLASTTFHFPDYFYAEQTVIESNPEPLPKYAGYWVGYNLVRLYFQQYPERERDAVSMPADTFFGFAANELKRDFA